MTNAVFVTSVQREPVPTRWVVFHVHVDQGSPQDLEKPVKVKYIKH